MIAALKRDGQITRQLRGDASIASCIRDRCVIKCKGVRSGIVRRRALAAFDGELFAGELLAVDE